MIKTSINTKNNLGDGVLLLSKELFFVLFVLAIVLIFHPARTDAATFDVAAGSSTVNDGDSICQLEEAGTNINDGARTYADCEETGTYGSNDTIQLPAGTINLSGSGLELRNSAKIIGNGKGISIIDGGDYQGGIRFYGSGSGIGSGLTLPDFVIRNFTLSNLGSGIALGGGGIGQLTVEGLEIKNAAAGIFLGGFEEISVTDSYLHDINYVGSGIPPTGIIALSSFDQQFSGKTVNVNIENTTISDTSVGVILYAVGSEGSGSGSDAEIYTGTVDATIQNTTFANLHSTGNEPDPISAAAGISTFVGGATITYNTINNTYSNISSS